MLNNHPRDRDQMVFRAKKDLIIHVSPATPIQSIPTILTTSLALIMKLLFQHHLTLSSKHIINLYHVQLVILLNQTGLDDLLITGPNLCLNDHNFLQGRHHPNNGQVDLGIDPLIHLKDPRQTLVIIPENQLLCQTALINQINKDR